MRDLAEQRIQGKVRAASPFEPANHLERAMLAAFDGHDAEAAEFLARRVRARWEWRLALSMPLFDTVRRRAEFQSAVREQQAVLERQRKEVLAILCGGNPLPEAYRPQPGTCAGHKESAG
jgi:hypothetical protein